MTFPSLPFTFTCSIHFYHNYTLYTSHIPIHTKWQLQGNSSSGKHTLWTGIQPRVPLRCRGNFKMNGSIKMIESLVDQLNNAKLDGKTGKPSACLCSTLMPFRGRRSPTRHLPPPRPVQAPGPNPGVCPKLLHHRIWSLHW